MGKKSKKKQSPKAAPLTEDHPVTLKNPDGSKSLVQRGELAFHGGRTMHMGHAAMPSNAGPYTFDLLRRRDHLDGAQMGERQLMNVQAMSDAFHRQRKNEEVDPMTEAALSLETKVGLKHAHGSRNMKLDGNAINESMVMSTHRWIITVLPSAVVQQVSEVAMLYRDAVRDYQPAIKIEFPEPRSTFEGMDLVTEDNRPEVIALMNTLLEQPFGVNVYVYSESDREIHLVIKDFTRSSKGLVNLPLEASSSDIMDYVHNQAGIMDMACCYWCEKNKLSTEKLFVCRQCMAVSYCSRECQAWDWKAFHKEECAKLSGKDRDGRKMTRDDLGLMLSRSATLRKEGVAKPRFPMQIADINNDDHVFRGDELAGYITHVDTRTAAINEKTKFFPFGLHIIPREIYRR